MTKKEIVRAISEETGLTQSVVKEIVQKTFDTILDSLTNGDRVELRNFGVFSTKMRKERTGRNMNTGEPVQVPACRVVQFRPSKEMERRVAQSEQEARFAESGFDPKAGSTLEKTVPSDDNTVPRK